MDIYIDGKLIRLRPAQAIGKGGEADIYKLNGSFALKVYKPPNHPDLIGSELDKKAAEWRINEQQLKLPAFPKNLPDTVIKPEKFLTNRKGNKILGYAMKLIKGADELIRYSDRGYRQIGVANSQVVNIFSNLHETVRLVHAANVIIGDFNDLNVLVKNNLAYIIDADSMQYDKFKCHVFTTKFVDPLLCDSKATSPLLVKSYNADSDWYAFAVMLMQSLLFVDPYGGVYRPKNKKRRVTHGARPLNRITVFHPDVKYPKPAVPYNRLPDEMLQYFFDIFIKDKRGPFPLSLLEGLNWTTCVNCGLEHARNVCPECQAATPAAVKETTTIRGDVKAIRFFRTSGVILHASYQNGKMQWLYHENGKFRNQEKTAVIKGDLDPRMRFRIQDNSVLLGMSGQVLNISSGYNEPIRLAVDSYKTLPLFDTNSNHTYWISNGQLYRDDMLGPKYIGDVLTEQTLFWVGPEFGFGFYRAGNLNVSFIFDADKAGINDSIKLPRFKGQLIDATCVFAKQLAWFFVSTQVKGKTINHCFVITPKGEVLAQAEADLTDNSWLSTIRGKCAASNFLLAATDDGIVRLEVDRGKIVITRNFPDTEGFVHAGCHLFPANEGLYVVDRQEIKLLKITQTN